MTAIAALYVHIPFCRRICPFCAFAVHGHRDGLRQGYLASLRRELALTAARWAHQADVASVYIGGGTPSTLTAAEVRGLLAALRAEFFIRREAEVAFEVNPEDASPAYLAALREAGVTRVSLGIQSLDDATLRALGRSHTAAQSAAALEALEQAGIANANADLMFGAPGIPGQAFRRDVEALIARGLPHLSLYALDVEERTPFGRRAAVRAWAAERREEQAEFYLWAHDRLAAAGYRHYEVSNFCLPGHEGRQNLLVWSGQGYLGLGQGAHSCVEGERWHNARHLRAYQRELAAGRLPIAFHERLTGAQRANERLMLALRQDGGLDIPGWERDFCQPWDAPRRARCEALRRAGQARYDGERLALTPAGFLLADEITAALMAE
jgi:oxygen-independent coproporphyrinogen-3 oxidase